MKTFIFSIIFLFSFSLLKEVIEEPPSNRYSPTRDEMFEIMKSMHPCFDKEVDFDVQEWPFQQCFQEVNCPEEWKCSNDACVCEPIAKSNYEYIFSGFQEAYDPSFWEDPLSWFSYSDRTKKILLELKSDREKLLILPVREEDIFEMYTKGDEVRIYEDGVYTKVLSALKIDIYVNYEIYNINISRDEIVKTLYNCKGYHRCERENYLIYSGSSPENKWHKRERRIDYSEFYD